MPRPRPLPTAFFRPEPDKDPWERQTGEGTKAFEAFTTYKNLGSKRTLAATRKALGRPPGYQRSVELFSQRWGWPQRATAYDAHIEKQKDEKLLDEKIKKSKEKLAVADSLWKTAARGIVMWNRYLEHFDQQCKESGEMLAPPISPGDVNRLAEAGLKLSQLLDGLPTDIQESRARLSIEDQRKKIHRLMGTPKLREAMRKVSEALDDSGEENDEPEILDADGSPIH